MATLPAHMDTPVCPSCKAQTVKPFQVQRELSTEGHLMCCCCGKDWLEMEPAAVEKAWKAQKAWERFSAGAERQATAKRTPRR